MTPNLAEACEKAEGPDREIDARIWCALNGKKYKAHFGAYGKPGMIQVEYTEPPRRTRCVTHDYNHALPVTASIDAAMTLVPEGFSFGAGRDNIVPGPEGWAWVSNEEDYQLVRAATPALALVAAALRARANQPE